MITELYFNNMLYCETPCMYQDDIGINYTNHNYVFQYNDMISDTAQYIHNYWLLVICH